ncbi:MAG: radical SAM protein [Pseudomonadota bacterium]
MTSSGPLLTLSRFVRLYQDGERTYVEAVLGERSLALEPTLETMLRALASAPLPVGELLARVSGAGTGNQGLAMAQLSAMMDLGLAIPSDDEDRARYQRALTDPAPFPVIDQVEVTNHCPMTCVMCSRGCAPTRRPLGFMDPALFAELVTQIADAQRGTKPLTLHNAGEPLLHRALEQLVRVAAQARLRPELSTNPAHLTLDRYLALRDAGLARVVLSLDGMSARTLHAIRGPAARFERAMANIDAILAYRASHQEREPVLVLQMLRLDLNRDEHLPFIERFGGLHDVGAIAYLKDLDAGTDPALAPDAALAPPFFCRAPWRSLVVLWDGRVVPCCYDPEGLAVVGDLRRQSMSEIWRGSVLDELRARLQEGDPDPQGPCVHCVHRPDRFQRPSLDVVPFEPLHW